MSRGYGKSYSRKGGVQTSIQFDTLFNENSNRPSAVRSAGTVGKWGITSFTSIRNANGLGVHREDVPQKRLRLDNDQNNKSNNDPFSFDNSVAAPAVIKPKKFFKSRNPDPPETGVRNDAALYTQKTDFTYTSTKKTRSKESKESKEIREQPLPPPKKNVAPPKTSPRLNAPKKFYSSKNSTEKIESKVICVPAISSNRRDHDSHKPPIVLRISKGKSRLLSDSDESTECTPSPTIVSVGLTSPSSKSEKSEKSESSSSKSPAHGRVTRSSRRNQQSDPESAGLSDSNDPFPSLFMSPRKSLDSEPQYIPAEEYELERKAIYENLLGAGSPTYTPIPTVTKSEETTPSEEEHRQQQEEVAPAINLPETDVNCNSQQNNNTDLEDKPRDVEDKSAITEEETLKTMEIAEELLASTNIDLEAISPEKILEKIPKKSSFEQDWTSDSESDDTPSESLQDTTSQNTETNVSSQPETETKQEEEKPPDEKEKVPPVKLVISKKKGSIFKSRSLVSGGTKKRHALYKHKWCDDKDAQTKTTTGNDSKTPESNVYEEMDFETTQLTRVTHWPGENADPMDEAEAITSIKCTKKAKGFYTVVRNVKKAHQIQEIGEFQEFNDDVDYILDALQDNNPVSTRCLSAITLATKCMTPAFRMHVRAHGTVAKFFKALHDSASDQSLGLCTATVMFVLSQDRLNMDLDRDCLELMLNLLESDVSHKNALDDCGLSTSQLDKNKQKVREICADIKSQGHALHLNLDNITVGQLAMETLLSLTSKRAGEWFKEELRELGGLEHIVKTICECCRQLSDYVGTWTDPLLDKLRKVDRCMRVLENVTHVNEENQIYILKYNNGAVLDTLVKLYRLCDAEIPLYPVTDIQDKEATGTIIREALLVTLKVLINLTHHFNSNSMGSSLLGSRQGIVDASLHLLLQVPNYIPEQKKFELSVLVLMLLINLIQHCDANKKLLLEAKAPSDFESIFTCDKSAIKALIEQFYAREQSARQAEQRTNAILDGEKDAETPETQSKSQEEFIEETVHKLLQKAGTHMEHTMIASYIVLLLGYVIMDNEEYENHVRSSIPTHNFLPMHDLLVKFFNFMKMTASGEAVSVCHIKATEKVIKYLEKCDKKMEEKQQQIQQQQQKKHQQSTSSSSPLHHNDDTDSTLLHNLNITSESDERHTITDTSSIDLDMSNLS